LTSDGTLWKLSAEGPQTVEQGLMGALALAASTGGSPVVLFPDRLMLAGGKSIPLPFEALRMGTLSDGSTWVGGRGMAARLDAEGKILWTWKGGLTPSGIALGGGFLAAGTEEGFLVALDATTGREKFRYPTGAAIVSAPAIAGGLAVFASRDHLVRAVRLRDGQLAWQVRLEGRPDFGPLPTRAGLVFAVYASATLIALNPADGRRTWSWRLPAGAVLQSPSATPDQVAVLAWGEAETPTLFLVPVPEPPPPPVRPKRKPRRESFEDR
jgi:outer membrane protein assembly factor BamB